MSVPGSQRVLVVDDNPDAATWLAKLLRAYGHEVHTANSGDAAIELALAVRPDTVFLDLGMPGLDGFDVAKRLRQAPELVGVRIIAVSGQGSEAARDRASESGIDQHLVKPVDPRFFESLLGRARGPER